MYACIVSENNARKMPASKIDNADERNRREKRRKNTPPDVPKDKPRQETDKVQLHRQKQSKRSNSTRNKKEKREKDILWDEV